MNKEILAFLYCILSLIIIILILPLWQNVQGFFTWHYWLTITIFISVILVYLSTTGNIGKTNKGGVE